MAESWSFEAPVPGSALQQVETAPTFSVIIPAFNAATTIGEAVESVLAQTVTALEVVVCDDGSTDSLDAALAPYRDQVRLVRKDNGGEGSAKDAASRAALGEFVVVLDADDAFLPGRIEALASLATSRPDLDILTTDAYLEADGAVVRRCYSDGWTFETGDQPLEILRRNFVFGAAAIRRERLFAVGGFDRSLRYAADWDLWIRMIRSGSRAGLVSEPLYRYRIGPQALSAQRAPLVRGFVTVLERAAARLDLGPDDRLAVEDAIATRRRELLALELDRSLAEGGSAARRPAVALLGSGLQPPRARAKAAMALLAPGVAARLYARRRAGAWVGAGGTLVTGPKVVRLLVYTDAEETGGAEISLGNLLAGLSPSYDVTVMGVDERVVAGIAARRPGASTALLAPVRRKHDLRGIHAHVRAVRSVRPAIVHVSMKTPWACRYGIFAAFLTRARVVIVEQSLFPETRWLPRAFAWVSGRRAAAVVAVGERSAVAVERLVGLPRGSVRTIYNGVPDIAADPSETGHDGPVIGSVGRLDPEKGFETLVRALTQLPATAVLVGDGPDRERLEGLAADLGVSERLVVTG